MKLIISSIFILLFGTCGQNKKLAASAQTKPDVSKVQITYQRGACMGRCPSYLMVIDGATKKITFNGTQNVDKIGSYSKPITEEEIIKLIEAFNAADFNTLEDKYLGQIVDFPSKHISYSNNGKVKKVQDRSGAPEKLHVLETALEAIADNKDGWTKDQNDH
jgi:hypothetical protein